MNHISKEHQTLLILLRNSLWRDSVTIPSDVNWELIGNYAKEQGVTSFIYDGAIAAKVEVPNDLLQKWKNTTLQGIIRNERLLHAQDELFTWFEQAGIPGVVLKGSSVSRYYPQPDLRVLGDIDILVNKSDVDKAREILEQHGYVFHESDHEFHLGFARPGSYVELHYNVTKLPDSAGGRAAKRIIDTYLEDTAQGNVGSHYFPILSESNQAMSLLLHMIRHMFESGIGLRQLCDWAVYMASVDMDLFKNKILSVLGQCGLRKYAEIATQSCVKYLGLSDENMAWCECVSEEKCRLFIADVFRAGNMGSADQESMGSLFTDADSMGKNYSSISALFSQLTKLSYRYFPVTQKYKVILPLSWVYLVFRYYLRMITGKRPYKSIKTVISTAREYRKLYEIVEVFDIEK